MTMTTAQNQTFDRAQPTDFGADARRFAASMPFPAKALTVAAGFVIFPPLGIVTLGYFIYQSRRAWRESQGGALGWGDPRMARCGQRDRHRFHQRRGMTGNAALDEKREETLRALDEEAEAFHDFRRKERDARDREAFDRFMKARDAGPTGETIKP